MVIGANTCFFVDVHTVNMSELANIVYTLKQSAAEN